MTPSKGCLEEIAFRDKAAHCTILLGRDFMLKVEHPKDYIKGINSEMVDLLKEEQRIEQKDGKIKSILKRLKRYDDYDQQHSWQTLEDETEKGNYQYWLQEHDIVHIARVEFGYDEGYRKIDHQTQISEQTEGGKVFYEKTSSKTVFVVSDLNSLAKTLANFKDYINKRNELRTLTTVINLGGGHWVTLVIANQNGQHYAYYSDSLGSEIIPDVKKELKSKIAGSVNVMDLKVKQQEHVYNCGIFALENAHVINEALQQNKLLDEIIKKLGYKFTNEQLKERRKSLVENLLKDHDRRSFVIVYCDMINRVETSLQSDGLDLNTLDKGSLRTSLDLNDLQKSSIEKQYLEIATFAVEQGADTSDLSINNKKIFDNVRKYGIEYNQHSNDFHSTVQQKKPNPSNSELEQPSGLSSDKVKNNDPNRASSSQRSSSDDSQSVGGNQPIDSDDEREKNTELFSSIKNGNLQRVQELLKAGVKVNIIDKNNKNNTPLHYAVERYKKEIAEKLQQEWKADINAKNNKGNTPLHIATSKGNKELVQLLVSNKAKTDIKNSEGKIPLELAKDQEIINMLKADSSLVHDNNSQPEHSLIEDRENHDLEEQRPQVQAQLNQDSFDVYNRLNQVIFNSDDSDNPGAWAGIDQINSYINQAIKTSAYGDELAYYIGPSNFGFDSTESKKDIAKHICRKEGISNSFYGAKESLDKPFIVISNTATVLAQSSTDVNQQGGTHWISWVLLPKKYVSLSGKEINNPKYQVFFFDSLSQRSFPEGLKKFLTEGGEITEETDEGDKQIKLMPFCGKEEIDFKSLKDLTGQQINENDCGWWATYYALMSVYTGGVEFLKELKGKKLSAKPLRRVMKLQESTEYLLAQELGSLSVRQKNQQSSFDDLKRQDIVEILEPHIQPKLQASARQASTQHKRTRTNSGEVESEDSNPKKQNTSSPDGQTMGVDQDTSSRKRSHEDNLIQGKRKRICILDRKNTYDSSGSKHTLHGNVYQLKLLMLFLKRGLNKRYSFRLATEMDAAEKFDDLVFQYENERKDGRVYRFLQAKHKQDESKKIAANDLLTEKDEDFSLQKYFLSYRKIKQNPEFNDQSDELKDVIIYTNIGLKESLRNSFEPVAGEDDILKINGVKSERLKFKTGGSLTKERLASRFAEVSDLRRLAKKLAEYVFVNNNSDKTIDLKDDLFKKYHGALAERVIDLQTKKFKEDFVSGTSQELKNFRSAFLKAYQEMSKKQMNVNEFWQKMKAKKLQISQSFGKILKLKENPQINGKKTFNKSSSPLQELAEHIANLIAKGDTPIKIEQRANIIKENIAKLIGHVFVKTKNGKKIIRQGFLNGDTLPGNLNDFREELKTKLIIKKAIQFSQLDQYQFEINIDTCTEDDYKEYKGDKYYFEPRLPNDEVRDKEIDDFLDKLVFAINQPNEVELGNVIEAEMGEDKDINLIDSELIASKFQKDMLDWMKEKKGRFLSYKDGNIFFKEAQQKLFKLVLIGPTLEYRAKIEDFGIAFSKSPAKLRSFLDSQEKQIFNLVSLHKTIISSIKIHQTLKGISKYQKDDSHIFICLSSLFRIQDRAIKAFESKLNDLLLIECRHTVQEKKYEELYNQLSSIIQSNSNKKVILITQEQDPLAAKFKEDSSDKYLETRDEKNSLIDLTNESQNKLLSEGKVIFQGEEVSLGTLVDDGSKHLLGGEELSKLINNEEIKIGKAPTDSKYHDVKDYYISRKFCREVNFSPKDLREKEFFVTDSNQFDKSKLQKDQDIVLISHTGESFKDLCDNHKKHNIHWLKQEGDVLIWQQSYGALSQLRKIVKKDEPCILEYKPEAITDIKDRVVILSDKPGMGKSTVLTFLALKTKKSLWIIRVNLLDYSTQLKRETEKKTKLNEEEAIKFLYRIVGFQLFQKEKEETTEKKVKREQTIEKVLSAITVKDSEVSLEGAEEKIKSLNLLEIRLFNHFYNQGSIVLLFDGFDEVSPDYVEKVIELLQVLKNSKVEKLWITTRPYNSVQEELENQLSVFSYSLKPLLPKEQKRFLRKFWIAKLKLEKFWKKRKCRNFIDLLFCELFLSIDDKDFMSIPLHSFMVGTVFEDAFKRFYDSNKQKLSDETQRAIEGQDLLILYGKFIDIKYYEICFREKKPGMNIDDPEMERIVEDERKKFIEDHMKLALYEIFNKDEVEKLLSQEEKERVTKLIYEIKQGRQKAGIIEQVIDNEPRFIHRTFAEYFVSELIFDRLKKNSNYSTESKKRMWEFLLDNIFLGQNQNYIRVFINRILANKSLQSKNDILLDYIKDNDDINMMSSLQKEIDGENMLSLTIEESLEEIANVLLAGVKKDLDRNNLHLFINFINKNSLLRRAVLYEEQQIVENVLKLVRDVDSDNLYDVVDYDDDGLGSSFYCAVINIQNDEIADILLRDIDCHDDIVEIINGGHVSTLFSAVKNYLLDRRDHVLLKYIGILDWEHRGYILNDYLTLAMDLAGSENNRPEYFYDPQFLNLLKLVLPNYLLTIIILALDQGYQVDLQSLYNRL